MRDQIIHLLKHHEGYFSGEEISRKLNISRSGIWKNIEELRKEGYSIDAATQKGYRLLNVPDKMLAREIKDGLLTSVIGQDILHYDSISSTMEKAFALAVDGQKEGTVVCAETQTKGKGRMGRNWNSPSGKGIYVSIILRPRLSPAVVSQLTLLSAAAVCAAIRQATGLEVTIKWPNDILFGKKKIAGILTEISAEMDCVRFVIVGIGINVNTAPTQLPEHATSLKSIASKKISRVKVLQAVLNTFETEYREFTDKGFKPVIKKWKELSSTLGSRVCLSDQNGAIQGEAVDLDEFGGLMIKQDNGIVIKRMSGDVIHV